MASERNQDHGDWTLCRGSVALQLAFTVLAMVGAGTGVGVGYRSHTPVATTAQIVDNALGGAVLAQLSIGAVGVLTVTGEYSSGDGPGDVRRDTHSLVLGAKAGMFGLVACAVGELSAYAALIAGQVAISGSPVPRASLGVTAAYRSKATLAVRHTNRGSWLYAASRTAALRRTGCHRAYPGAMTEPAQWHARSFGSTAARYDRYRPTYAAEAITWALGERAVRVADVGAGTGILSRLLQRLGHEVIAVEPDDLMRAQLAQVSPGVSVLAGAAEEIPLPDGSVDAVVAGQAYHWFNPAEAHPEIARVLRPGGIFAALWNDCDLEAQWTVQFGEIIDGDAAASVRPISDFGEHFGPVAWAEFRHDVWMTPDDLVALATTRSPYLVASPQRQHEIVAAVRQLMAESELAGRERFLMPHVTRVHRAAAS